jgi:hypothetical protein
VIEFCWIWSSCPFHQQKTLLLGGHSCVVVFSMFQRIRVCFVFDLPKSQISFQIKCNWWAKGGVLISIRTVERTFICYNVVLKLYQSSWRSTISLLTRISSWYSRKLNFVAQIQWGCNQRDSLFVMSSIPRKLRRNHVALCSLCFPVGLYETNSTNLALVCWCFPNWGTHYE